MHYITQPMTLSRTPAAVKVAAPKWGEHTDEVLKEAGFNADQIKAYYDAGVV